MKQDDIPVPRQSASCVTGPDLVHVVVASITPLYTEWYINPSVPPLPFAASISKFDELTIPLQSLSPIAVNAVKVDPESLEIQMF